MSGQRRLPNGWMMAGIRLSQIVAGIVAIIVPTDTTRFVQGGPWPGFGLTTREDAKPNAENCDIFRQN